MHIRRAILEALQTQLKTLTTFAGVWIQRTPPKRIAYPCATLFADAETTETLLIHPQPRKQERVITVTVRAWVKGATDDEKVEVDMDAAAVLIESVMTTPANASDIVLAATDFDVVEEEPELNILTLTYHISYFAVEFTPTA